MEAATREAVQGARLTQVKSSVSMVNIHAYLQGEPPWLQGEPFGLQPESTDEPLWLLGGPQWLHG
jgi:hypothetical protein